MPRKFLNRYLPDQETIHRKLHGKWYMRPFDFLWHEPAMWHITRRGSCRAIALGAFIACVPIPGTHMILAVLGAIYFRINLPVALVAVWISNPLTYGPMLYMDFQLGTWAMHLSHLEKLVMEPATKQWHVAALSHAWPAFQAVLVGSVMEGLVFALVGYFAFDLAWRLSISGRWKLRQIEREGRKQG